MIKRFKYIQKPIDIDTIPDPVRSQLPEFDEDGRMRLSVSRMQIIAKCPRAFKFAYIDKMRVEFDNKILAMGKLVHDGIYKASICGEPEQIRKTEDYDKATDHFENYIDLHNELARDHGIVAPYLAEYEIIDPDDNVVLYIDRINELPDGTYEIVDYKTGKIHAMPRHYFQLSLYTYYFEKHTGLKVSKWSIFYTKHNKYKSVDADRSRVEMIPEFVRLVREQQNEFKDAGFPKRPSIMCDYCDYRNFGICDGKNLDGKVYKDPFGILDIYSKTWTKEDITGSRAVEAKRKIMGGIRVV